MKIILMFIVIILGISLSSSADSFRLKGVPFPPPKVKIVWQASTTNLPEGLWIYKVIPRDFSMAVISNALAMSSLQMRNIVNPRDTNIIRFQDKANVWEANRILTITPASGHIEFNDKRSSMKIPEDVPNEKEAVKLAWHYLFLLGVDRSEVITPLRGHSDSEMRFNYKTGRLLWKGIFQRTVGCDRRIDGLKAIGGNFNIVFGSHATIKSFDLSWPALLPYECHPVAGQNEIINYIRRGQAVLPVVQFNFKKLSKTKRLTVTKITPYYFYEPSEDGLFHPFAQLEVSANLGKTNFNFQLRCPILSTNAFTVGKQ
jgi:hypothetical protein